MKTPSTRVEPAKAQKPYNDTKRPRQRTAKIQKPVAPPSLPAVSASSTPSGSSTQQAPAPGTEHFRKICAEKVRENYPGLEPRCDFDLLQLATRILKGTHAEIYAALDEDLAMNVGLHGYELTTGEATKLLDSYIEPTGAKPGSSACFGGDEFVFIRPIPESKYSLRLFPGSLSAAEYCLDFVDAAGKPVNSPFEFELWGVPDPDAPWLSMPAPGKLWSIEHTFGIKQQEIPPGAEKFILRDGQTCMLMRPGKRPLRFTVPLRRVDSTQEDVDVVDLPKVIG
ncbi:uncharacterized protein TRAVEDRAFT_41255 [Trametes versicolor FP-101664 SS1]|uniref:uncharacterized protein n=1 Tax=Trametes versicolor (strain FP-101664) TaxID=717944 RepID=UPI000462171A|nr:uncharacterized protein TRAVEDRAFT_41255 [Trametes versicolor FP-101664 SS1]EIW63827.1 hypothetical protein TRAVEDRAFT_41255 [Trametes versicolor FP-101664 SS1]